MASTMEASAGQLAYGDSGVPAGTACPKPEIER